MRKVILTSLLAGACAACAGSVGSGMNAKVENVCIFQANGVDINPASSTITGTSIDLGTYRANKATASATTVIALVQCNRGTQPTAAPLPSPFSLNRQGGNAGGSPLVARLLAGTELVDDRGNRPGPPGPGGNGNGNSNAPDVYNVYARVELDAGQWGVVGGRYQGMATVTVRYD